MLHCKSLLCKSNFADQHLVAKKKLSCWEFTSRQAHWMSPTSEVVLTVCGTHSHLVITSGFQLDREITALKTCKFIFLTIRR